MSELPLVAVEDFPELGMAPKIEGALVQARHPITRFEGELENLSHLKSVAESEYEGSGKEKIYDEKEFDFLGLVIRPGAFG
jgi:hypothetical protein